ncbi:diacylglycerol lipase-alpha-like [Ruditapes philippinarum]|uniref:diacylglycerol lipase-alpha-like n=1 Tax=Ruditapes philippinarum TaxID=129788 RepID=UPI00295A7BDF|nr:diacylglycerol lipase-alpha-like [Ruditapes philippinarum]
MPGIVVFGRRWSVGSDDMVLPAIFMLVGHIIWLGALSYIFSKVEFDPASECSRELKDIVLGYIVILLACIIVESIITLISVRGSILETQPRLSMQYLLYIRIGKS